MLITKTRVLVASLIAIMAVASRAIAAEEIHTVIIVGAGMSGECSFSVGSAPIYFPYAED